MKGVKVKIVTSMGDIDCQFYADKAPIHVWNFITRAESGFYDNTKFHRIIPGFMIQGGDPNTKSDNAYSYGQGGPLVPIPHEFNDVHHRAGILSMARVSDVSMGAGSQFFVMHGEAPHLDNQYTAFGEVVAGMDVVNAIAAVETNRLDPMLRDQPVKPVVIKKMIVSR
ncbi:MAG: peptidylprolyl isomerase [Fibrobacteres bacterium]|nr:peptidylprolyl isomerase [Fibrobacterota bacterium]